LQKPCLVKQVVASLAILALPGITVVGTGSSTGEVRAVVVRVTATGLTEGSGLLARIRAAGVEDAALDQEPAMVLVHGHLTEVTRADVEAVSQAARDYDKSHAPAPHAQVSFYGMAEDCPAIEQRARRAALEDARRRAAEIVAWDNVRLGDVIADVEAGGCQRPCPFGGMFLVDTSTMTMRVGVEETMTFAIAK
jgi:hypothetical protein